MSQEQGETSKRARLEETPARSSVGAEMTTRGRGGFRTAELHTIPEGVRCVKAGNSPGQPVEVLSNFIKIEPMKEREIYQYRIDFEPNVESVRLRRQLFRLNTQNLFSGPVTYDGMSDARCGNKTQATITIVTDTASQTKITIKFVGTITWGSFEIIRLYNMHMKQFLRALGFFQVGQTGAYVHPQMATPIGKGDIMTVRGYRTAANIHETGQILMNLESVHKLLQQKNVLQTMSTIKGPEMRENARIQLIGKLVVTNYNKVVYKIEDINFDLTPASTFYDKRVGREVRYVDYYQEKYNLNITDKNQPLLLVVQNNRRQEREGDDSTDIYLVPELCNIAGMTDDQRNDNRLKTDLIRSSQIPPADRVSHMNTFLRKLHENNEITQSLNRWGYSYANEPIKIQARILPTEAIGIGKWAQEPHEKWPKVDQMASFDQAIQRENLAKPPTFPKMVIVISRRDENNEETITDKLYKGFQRVGLKPVTVEFSRIRQGDSAQLYNQHLRNLPKDTTAALVILPQQNKERYDTIKKVASVDMGLITQVVTSRLMCDERKAQGAAVKIGIQLAAKLGGEPWHVYIPIGGAMICGYDIYHDTANRGRSYGAFLASMNGKFSRWFSKADSHDRLDELSSHMTENLGTALKRYKELNNSYPTRVFIYRDGVGDGQLDHVFNVELKQLKSAVAMCDERIKLSVIIVIKRIGARFYLRQNNEYRNPPPGTVIDDIVTRQSRFDFYLISQSTRNGTVSPTYYNIIYDESGFDPSKHQMLAYKLCFLYYNWTGTVRVPAPCQYAHKLALLCGEHLHQVPNANLDERLHFL